jgi:hypothetical protein
MLAGLLIASSSAGAVPGNRLPELSFPLSVDITDVSPDLIRNGMPMRIYGFRSHLRIEDALADIGRHLEQRDYVVGNVLMLADVQTLGVSDQKHFINIQGQRTRHGQSSSGFIVITPRPDLFEPKMTTPSIPMPDDIDLLSHELYRDGSRIGESVLAISAQRASYIGHALVTGFTDDDWVSAPNEMKVTSDEIAVYRVLSKGERVCRLIAMDQTINGQLIATINVNCHN